MECGSTILEIRMNNKEIQELRAGLDAVKVVMGALGQSIAEIVKAEREFGQAVGELKSKIQELQEEEKIIKGKLAKLGIEMK